MEATFNFKMLTPNHTAFDGEVISIMAPGGAGYLGILAHHAPIITTLKDGDLKVRMKDNRVAHFKIGRGLLKVAHNTAIVLTESVEETGA